MLNAWSRRLLTLLQLTRMALVFTAIADAQAALLLAAAARAKPGDPLSRLAHHLRIDHMLAIAAVSIGLYGFGMSLNDIIDRRRDRQIAAFRPLPSGRVGIVTAHVICVGLALLAFAGGLFYYSRGGGRMGLALVGLTLAFITFYDMAGKYLVGPGLLTLGLVRFFHALIPAASAQSPHVSVLWHPLWLLNHVTILSTVCYQWEEKRPPLTRRHWWGVLGSLAGIDIAAILLVGRPGNGHFLENLNLRMELLYLVAASFAYAAIAWRLRRTSATSREAGQKAMLFGLLWLIVYDACFVAGYVHWLPAVGLMLLLPVAYAAVQLMRWWSKFAAVSQRPEFKRAGT